MRKRTAELFFKRIKMTLQKTIHLQYMSEAIEKICNCIGEVISLGIPISENYNPFAEYPQEDCVTLQLNNFRMRACVPLMENYNKVEYVDLPEQPAFYVYPRGDYADIEKAYRSIIDYANENNITPSGDIRKCYLDSRREYTDKQDRYVMQVILSVRQSINNVLTQL